MNRKMWGVFAGLCALAMSAVCAAPAVAQVSEKPPMYSYVGDWAIPRAQWAEMEKSATADQSILDKAIASGTIIAYGNDTNLVHHPEGMTHDDWWSSMSMAGLVNVLDQFYKSGNSVSPVLSSATKHSDDIFVSRYYNYHAGSWKGLYTHVSTYKLKADAPDDAVELLSKNIIGPVLDKLLTEGAIHEWEIDTQAIHTEAPGTFWVVYIAANAEGLDKASAAVREAGKANPLRGPTFNSVVDYTAHRDMLARTNATYK
ncbi:MAG TPA: hypothetical protein VFC15_02675 [Candidatus Limnocylindrales bacterium]|nr:hypothetical protein [Candidatus Limnocylindrales bacterium]